MAAAPTPLVAVLLGLLLGLGAAVAAARDVLVGTVLFGAYSLCLAVLWVLFRAPDVALTEAAVGAGVTTSLFLVAVGRTDLTRPVHTVSIRRDPRAVVTGGLVVAALGLSLPALPPVGDPTAPVFAESAAGTYYLDTTAALGIDNVVTAVLVVYRGFDTFGEIAVVVTAAVAVLAVSRREGSS